MIIGLGLMLQHKQHAEHGLLDFREVDMYI